MVKSFNDVTFRGEKFSPKTLTKVSDEKIVSNLKKLCFDALARDGRYGRMGAVYINPDDDGYIVRIAVTECLVDGERMKMEDLSAAFVVDKEARRIMYVFYIPMS